MSAVITRLRCLHSAATEIHDDLQQLEVTSGAVGAARTLVKKLESTIAFYEKNGEAWDQQERLACNAWRIAVYVDEGEGLPAATAWLKLADSEKDRWRLAASAFRTGGKD